MSSSFLCRSESSNADYSLFGSRWVVSSLLETRQKLHFITNALYIRFTLKETSLPSNGKQEYNRFLRRVFRSNSWFGLVFLHPFVWMANIDANSTHTFNATRMNQREHHLCAYLFHVKNWIDEAAHSLHTLTLCRVWWWGDFRKRIRFFLLRLALDEECCVCSSLLRKGQNCLVCALDFVYLENVWCEDAK